MENEIEQVLPNEDDPGLAHEFYTDGSNANDISNKEDIENMIQCRMLLNQLSENQQKDDYTHILALVTAYLRNHCHHEYVDDYIDISPDYGCCITYCKKCGLT